jgi:hypothetical protein
LGDIWEGLDTNQPPLFVFIPANFSSPQTGLLDTEQADLNALLQKPDQIQSLGGMLTTVVQTDIQQRLEAVIVPYPNSGTPTSTLSSIIPDLTSNPLFVATPTGHQPFTTLFTHIEPINLPPAMAPAGAAPGSISPDGTGLTSGFESALADAFTPIYHVSKGELDNFVTFQDSVPEEVERTQGINSTTKLTQPLSYYRVLPLGFTTANQGTWKGKEVGLIRIDYMTLWDNDDGLNITGLCRAQTGIIGAFLGGRLKGIEGLFSGDLDGLPGLIDGAIIGLGGTSFLDGIGGHALDHEHSAVLLEAPTVNGNFDQNAANYVAISYYTAAHEGKLLFDHSGYWGTQNPIAANNHINYSLTLRKHSTYPYNPNHQSILIDPIVAAYFAAIAALTPFTTTDNPLGTMLLDLSTQGALVAAGIDVFYSCIAETWVEAGGVIASPRINVGQPTPGNVLPGGGFILDQTSSDTTHQKLVKPLWTLSGGGQHVSDHRGRCSGKRIPPVQRPSAIHGQGLRQR